MNPKFECKVKWSKIDESTGKEKVVTEKYLVEAVNFSDAETRMHEEMAKRTKSEFYVVAIKLGVYSDVIEGEGILWNCRISFMDVDTVSGREKKAFSNVLIGAETVDEALKAIKGYTEAFIVNSEIEGINDSKIIDVIRF
jgi:hypothetical protein